MVEPLWQFWTNWIVQFAVAIGTLAAAIIALFGGWLRAHIVPPKLQLSLQNVRGVHSPCILTSPDGVQRESESRWYHAKVENLKRWSPATQTQVLLLNIEEPDAAGRYQSIWAGAMPLKWRSFGYLSGGRTVGYPVECDLCSVVRDGWIEIHPVVVEFPMKAQRTAASKFILTLQARSVETDSNILRVEIVWDGNWAVGTDEMARHMVLTVLP